MSMSPKSKSLYRQCSAAIEQLVATREEVDGEVRATPTGAVFTEIDVEAMAATGTWTAKDFERALKDANQVCGTQYRARKLCRYGPVVLADGSEDYARIAGKIVYADAETGPEFWETPNGKFPKLMVQDDKLTHQGRRHGTNRNDAVSWENQDLKAPRRPARRRASSVTSAKSEAELRKLLVNVMERLEVLEELERKRQRLYAHA